MSGPFGFVVIDKPAGLTSHDCVSRLRKAFGIKRVGHGGTLDPAVTGVLPIAIGNATRLLPYLKGDKTYRGVIKLGKRTITDDLEGELITSQRWPILDEPILEEYLNEFRGSILQTPPQISSVHFKGERSYIRARRGEKVDLPARLITIHQLLILNWDQHLGELEVNVHCSSGTYIRSLARDLGEAIGCGGCLARLRRTEALGFLEEQAIPLPERINNESLIPPNILEPLTALSHLPRIQLENKDELAIWRTGRSLIISTDRYQKAPKPRIKDQVQPKELVVVVVDSSEEIAGLAYWDEALTLKPKVVFNAKG